MIISRKYFSSLQYFYVCIMKQKDWFERIGIIYIFFLSLFAKEYEIIPSLVHVTIYPNGAMIERHAELNLPEGHHYVILSPLEKKIQTQSIQIKGTGNAVILDISTQKHYIDLTKSEPYKIYQDSLNYFQKQEKWILAQIANLEEEKNLLKANQSIKGENNNVTAQELLNVLNLYRSRLNEIAQKKIQLEYEKEKVKEEIERIKLILNQLSGRKTKTISQIRLEIWCKKSGKVALDISYLVPDAKWTPEYLIKVTEMGKPIQLEFYALVSQWTDQSWEQIPITVSTAIPTENLTIPTLSPWWLSLYAPLEYGKVRPSWTKSIDEDYGGESDGEYGDAPTFEEEVLSPPEPQVETTQDYTQVSASTLNLQFQTKIPYTIESDGKSHKVFLTTYEIPAVYQYVTIPKKDPSAFLTAVLDKWDLYHLIPANARLFFEGQYTGSFYLNPNVSEDSIHISLGKDPAISISYELLTQYTKVKTTGNYKREIRTYQIKIRNNKSSSVEIAVQDQIPLSTTSEIDITPQELNGGTLNKETGIVTWQISLAPNEVKTIQWSVEVKYPKNKVLENW